MKVVVSGSSGLVGSALVDSLRGDGHDVTRLVRREPGAADEVRWDPASRHLDDATLADAEAVVHLAGAGVADKRWTDGYKKLILDSRVDGTTAVAEAVGRNAGSVRVMISASAVGYYGDRGDQVLDESAAPGSGFLADVVRQWEAATSAASDAGVRVVQTRTGLVLASDGGVMGKTLPLFKLGLGGRLGSGRQWMPWIHIADEVAAIRFALDHDTLSGPVNLSAPEPVRNTTYTRVLGRAVHRPALAAVPAVALRLVLDGFADEGALVSQRVVPAKLLGAGFSFAHRELDAALADLL